MARRKRFNEDEFNLEDLENEGSEAENDSFFDHLRSFDDECPNCGYFGPMRSTRKGMKCPDCREIVVALDE